MLTTANYSYQIRYYIWLTLIAYWLLLYCPLIVYWLLIVYPIALLPRTVATHPLKSRQRLHLPRSHKNRLKKGAHLLRGWAIGKSRPTTRQIFCKQVFIILCLCLFWSIYAVLLFGLDSDMVWYSKCNYDFMLLSFLYFFIFEWKCVSNIDVQRRR